jgi:hypothetical protein
MKKRVMSILSIRQPAAEFDCLACGTVSIVVVVEYGTKTTYSDEAFHNKAEKTHA